MNIYTAFIKGKCPSCKKGNIFFANYIFTKKFFMTNTKCAVCNYTFEPEPGFYYGAMYISYMFSVAIAFASSCMVFLFFHSPSNWDYIITITLIILLLSPFNYRYSRIVYLYIWGK